MHASFTARDEKIEMLERGLLTEMKELRKEVGRLPKELWKEVGESPVEMEKLQKTVGGLLREMEELSKKVKMLVDVSDIHAHQLKLIIASNRNFDAQIEDDAYHALHDHLATAHTRVFSTTLERCPYLYGKPIFEWDGLLETNEGDKKVLWLIEAKRLVREGHIKKTIPEKLEKTKSYIGMTQNLDLSRFSEREQRSAARWATYAHHELQVAIASPNITRARARQILSAGFYCIRNTLTEPYKVFSPADIDRFLKD